MQAQDKHAIIDMLIANAKSIVLDSKLSEAEMSEKARTNEAYNYLLIASSVIIEQLDDMKDHLHNDVEDGPVNL